MDPISLSAVLHPEDSSGYVAFCPELDIASQGESIDEAVRNLKEAAAAFLFSRASDDRFETKH